MELEYWRLIYWDRTGVQEVDILEGTGVQEFDILGGKWSTGG